MPLTPPGSTERFVPFAGGRVRILSSESDPPAGARALLLLHGGGTDNAAISWYEAFPTFGRDHQLVAMDLPGFGATTGIAPLGGPAVMADFVDAVCERLGLRDLVVVGVSMGGDVALNLALRRTRRVAGLVLIGPGGLAPVFRNRIAQFAAWSVGQLPDALLVPLAGFANRYADAALRTVVSDVSRLPPPVRAEFVREARRPGAALGYLRYNQATLGPSAMRNNLLPIVHRITAPALFFHGADDPIVDPAGSAAAVAAMPHARLVLVPECGHWAHLEAPGRFATEATRFLSDL